ncbi:MAG: hypothetical protein QOE57_2097 [Acidimicrobiaceae bacterium]|nr:hypothetical protein [Acidimicrobiaceae bacterium]
MRRHHGSLPRKGLRVAAAVIAGSSLVLLGSGLNAAPAAGATTTSVNVACANVYGPGGLIQAINTANRSSRPSTISLAANCTYPLTVARPALCCSLRDSDGLPAVTSEVTILGHGTPTRPGATIARSLAAGSHTFRIIEVGPSGNLTLRGLNILGGLNYLGGGIYNNMGGQLALDHSNLTQNHSINANDSGAGGAGGGLTNAGTASFTNRSTVANNTSEATMNDSSASGGGIENFGDLVMADSAVTDNRVTALSTSIGIAEGGGIFNSGTMVLANTPVTGNTVETDTNGPFPTGLAAGGGIANDQFQSASTARLDHSPVTGNSVAAPGGGDARGGGIDVLNGAVSFNNGAINGNDADPRGAATAAGGGIYLTAGTVTLNQTRVTNNKPDNCEPTGAVPGCTA